MSSKVVIHIFHADDDSLVPARMCPSASGK